MIEMLGTAGSQLVSLVGQFDKIHRERFNELAAPLMAELSRIHGDYLAMFENALSELKQPTSELEQTLIVFAKARAKLHPDRVAFRNLIIETSLSSKSTRFKPFLESLHEWLGAFSDSPRSTSISSFFSSVMQQAAEGQDLSNLNASSVREDLAFQAESNIGALQEAWRDVTRTYAAMKVLHVP